MSEILAFKEKQFQMKMKVMKMLTLIKLMQKLLIMLVAQHLTLN